MNTEQLIKQYEPAVYKHARIFYKKLTDNAQRWITIDDMVQEGFRCIVKIAKIHNPKKSKFLTLLISVLRYRFQNLIVKHRCQKRYNESTDVPIDCIESDHINWEHCSVPQSKRYNTLPRSMEINADLHMHFKELPRDAQILASFIMKFEGATIAYTPIEVRRALNFSRRRLLRAAEQCSNVIGDPR